MQETIEFRIPESRAIIFLQADVGTKIGIARKLEVRLDDPLFKKIGELDRQLRERGEAFFTAWISRRRYSRRELEKAELFHVLPKRVFEPAGEECGTVYDESSACKHVFAPEKELEISGHKMYIPASTCGVGAQQLTPLFLDGRRIPRNVDFSRTIADELVVSARVVAVFDKSGLSGAKFDSIRLSNKAGRASEDHYQLEVVGQPVELDPVTRTGSDPFDESSYGRCPCGDVVGLNVLSEVTVRRENLGDADVMVTRQMIGNRQGLLRPRPILLLSPRAWRAIETAKLKGLRIEVAHLSP